MRLREEQVIATVGRVTVTELRLWQREGWISPTRDDKGPLFDELDVARIRLVCEMCEDLAFDEETIPVLLSLVDQIHGLRRCLRALAGAVDEQPDAVRRAVREAFAQRLRDTS
jgi:chaperone modulatory protein CbpM